ncbi:hypothetical protein JMUB4039_0311 [Leptotrichia trevisanii]|jgi:hypothetical protein|uniref:hypothetical protein n=2 Tax=Leptotrichia trevisanii TaxID=109328 RepID=UPI00040301BF|nr:hypothetical protein [Leptotrichia trevisanii]BBM56344.1 hypothetical protein JMUB4039_0311 [Leptotrichia trevisanii]
MYGIYIGFLQYISQYNEKYLNEVKVLYLLNWYKPYRITKKKIFIIMLTMLLLLPFLYFFLAKYNLMKCKYIIAIIWWIVLIILCLLFIFLLSLSIKIINYAYSGDKNISLKLYDEIEKNIQIKYSDLFNNIKNFNPTDFSENFFRNIQYDLKNIETHDIKSYLKIIFYKSLKNHEQKNLITGASTEYCFFLYEKLKFISNLDKSILYEFISYDCNLLNNFPEFRDNTTFFKDYLKTIFEFKDKIEKNDIESIFKHSLFKNSKNKNLCSLVLLEILTSEFISTQIENSKIEILYNNMNISQKVCFILYQMFNTDNKNSVNYSGYTNITFFKKELKSIFDDLPKINNKRKLFIECSKFIENNTNINHKVTKNDLEKIFEDGNKPIISLKEIYKNFTIFRNYKFKFLIVQHILYNERTEDRLAINSIIEHNELIDWCKDYLKIYKNFPSFIESDDNLYSFMKKIFNDLLLLRHHDLSLLDMHHIYSFKKDSNIFKNGIYNINLNNLFCDLSLQELLFLYNNFIRDSNIFVNYIKNTLYKEEIIMFICVKYEIFYGKLNKDNLRKKIEYILNKNNMNIEEFADKIYNLLKNYNDIKVSKYEVSKIIKFLNNILK